MFKLLFVGPFLLIGGAIALAMFVPLLALLPVALVAGAGVLGVVFALALVGIVFRIVAGLLVGIGGLLFVGLGLGALFVGGAVFVAVLAALAHLLLPVLFIVFLIWMIRRLSQPAPLAALPPAQGGTPA